MITNLVDRQVLINFDNSYNNTLYTLFLQKRDNAYLLPPVLVIFTEDNIFTSQLVPSTVVIKHIKNTNNKNDFYQINNIEVRSIDLDDQGGSTFLSKSSQDNNFTIICK